MGYVVSGLLSLECSSSGYTADREAQPDKNILRPAGGSNDDALEMTYSNFHAGCRTQIRAVKPETEVCRFSGDTAFVNQRHCCGTK